MSSSIPVHNRLREGDVVAGKYRVERVLGAGGMGMVVAAFHLQLRQRVAIKLLLPEASGGPDSIARFAREAQAAARIQSEHVARVIDVAALDDGSPYMVMEFLEGQDLGQVLASRGPLPAEEAIGYLLEACEGVAEAHAAGIVHRDLKPSNLFVCQKGGGRTIVKVLDFGISKTQPLGLGPGADPGLTRTGAVLGSPLYMSPEQMASTKHVDARTDVWSLGVTLFELLCGRTPFRGESMTELIAAVLQSEPMSVRDLRAEIPAGLAAVLARALEKDRTRRYANVAELAAALAPFGPRHAQLVVERIAKTVGSLPPSSLGMDRTLEALAPDATAQAVSGPVAGPVGNTTAQPVSSERARTFPSGHREAPPPRRWRWIVAGIAVAAAGGGAAAFKLRHPATANAAPQEAPTPAVAISGPPVVVAVPSTPSTATEAQPAAAASPVGAPSPPASAAGPPTRKPAPPRPAAPTPTAVPVVARPATPTPTAAPTCRVVQYLDADGETRFRRECP